MPLPTREFPASPEQRRRLAAHAPDPLARLPLLGEMYPPELRDDVLDAITSVLQSDPVPVTDEGGPVEGTRALPAGCPKLIVAQGEPRAGKDVIASHLRRTYAGVRNVMTSTAIRAECNEYLAPYGHRIVEANKSLAHYRHLLQAWGMARQEENPDYWPQAAIEQVQAAWQGGAKLVVITGLRWPHDAGRYRDIGAEIWRVERPGNPYQSGHYSENGFAGTPDSFFDRVLVNDVEGDLAAFCRVIDQALAPDAPHRHAASAS